MDTVPEPVTVNPVDTKDHVVVVDPLTVHVPDPTANVRVEVDPLS
jgi:hypothetical protein